MSGFGPPAPAPADPGAASAPALPLPDEYRASLRHFVATEVESSVAELEREGRFPHHLVRGLGERGLYEPCVPDVGHPRGGEIGVDLRYFRILIEELARSRCFGLTLTASIHVGVFLPLVARLASEPLRGLVLAGGRRGTLLGAFAATEEGTAGSDFAGMRTSIEQRGDRIVVNGEKQYIANAAVADHVVVFGRHRPGRDFTSFSAVLVPTGAPGVRRSRTGMAVMRTSVTSRIEFHGVELDASHLLGRHGLGLRYFLEQIAVERLSGGIWAVAAAEECLDDTRRYAQARLVGTESLWDRSSVRHRLAQAAVRLTLLRALTDRLVGDTITTGRIDRLDSAVLKAAIAPAMEDIIGTCLQLHGAYGLRADSSLLRLLNDFRVFGIAGGSTETMLDLVAQGMAEQKAPTRQAMGSLAR